MAHAWKAWTRKGLVGSNPTSSAFDRHSFTRSRDSLQVCAAHTCDTVKWVGLRRMMSALRRFRMSVLGGDRSLLANPVGLRGTIASSRNGTSGIVYGSGG